MTSQLWTALEQENANNIRKWLYGTVLVRDWDPAGSTTLSGVTPFVSGGNLVTTLMDADNPGGPWYDLGYLDDNGVDFTPKYTTDETDVWQVRIPPRIDVTKDGEEIAITAAETNPVVDCLFNNQPLSNLNGEAALQTLGAANYQVTYSNVPQIIYRQLMVIGVDAALDDAFYVAELRPKTSVIKMDKRSFNAKKADMFGLTFGVYIDQASGFAKSHIYGGPAWLALGGSITPPEVTTVTGTVGGTAGTASLAFSAPTTNSTPITYTVEATVSTTTTAATVGTPTVADGVVTLDLTGLAAGATTFVVTATSANLDTYSYPASNSVTITS
jgi:hypothetical protein